MTAELVLTGDGLTVDDVWAAAVDGASAALSDDARGRMRAARDVVTRAAHGEREHTYGINTGFGRFVSQSIPAEQTEELQLRLLRSHACGVGEPYPPEVVRAAMLLRANTLAKGTSGARVELVELLVECLNRGVLPLVPSRGSVGASGDLAPLAHLALPLVGEGEAWVEGRLLPGRDALSTVSLEPIVLHAKEGLSLVNGTQFMAAFGALGLVRARRLQVAADLACAMSVEALNGTRTSFLPRSTRCDRSAASRRRRRTSSSWSKARRSSRRTAGATRFRIRTRSAARRRCTEPCATCSTTSTRRLDRAECRDRQSARARRRRHARLERELPR